ncbi:MAG: SPOR domain-containing protein [Armatimonadota bacterium]
MASGKDSAGARLLASVKFWAVVAVLCAIVGIAAFHFGRNYVGEHLHEMEVQQRAPEIKPQSGAHSPDDREDTRSNPPIEPVVTVQEREPTSREERRARRELEEPQDGAQLHAAEAAEAAADEEDGDAETETPSSTDSEAGEEQSAGREGGYVVAAGAFADEANAKRQVQRLAEQGHQPFITTQDRDGITYRRVNVGTFSSREEAESVQEKLISEGFDAAVWSEG